MIPTRNLMVKRSLRLVVLALSTFTITALTAGCSLVTMSSTSQYRDHEGAFSGELIQAIKPNETSEDWLLKHFGTPTSVQAIDADERLLTWQFLLEKHHRKRVLFLFDSSATYREPRFLHALVYQQNVLAAWVDGKQKPVPQVVPKALPEIESAEIKESSSLSVPAAMSPEQAGDGQTKADSSLAAPAADLDSGPVRPDTDDPLGRQGVQVDDEAPQSPIDTAAP